MTLRLLEDGPKRIQRSRQPGWRMPEGAVYVGRPTRWGNPWAVGDPVELRASGPMRGPGAGAYDASDERGYQHTLAEPVTLGATLAVALYEDDLRSTLAHVDDDSAWQEIADALAELRGHDLACWCKLSDPCHADVLLRLANP